MIKKIWEVLCKCKLWFLLFSVLYGVCIVFLWLIDPENFQNLALAVALATIGLYSGAIFFVYRSEAGRQRVYAEFLEHPADLPESLERLQGSEKKLLTAMADSFREKERQLGEQHMKMDAYEEYIETWAHEVKTPLSLMAFVTDNRREEMSETVYYRLEYIRNQIQEDIEKMIYYTRLKGANQDYLLEPLSLKACCSDVLEEYGVILRERQFAVINKVEDIQVVSDGKGLRFLLRQVISNSVKYTGPEEDNPCIYLYTEADQESGSCILGIRDNGIGVKPYDLPHLFNKGFTGDTGDARKKATGMGLYLAKQVADGLRITVKIGEGYEDGFEIRFLFPLIEM